MSREFDCIAVSVNSLSLFLFLLFTTVCN